MRPLFKALLLLFPVTAMAQQRAFHYAAPDSAVTVISTAYRTQSFLHDLIMGTNYRKTWGTPVKLPLFYLSQSGLRVEKLGGGQQTKSLRLKDKSGNDWVLRTVDKNVETALPPVLRNTIAEKVVQDMISGSHPYSALIVRELVKATHITAPIPRMYLVVSDPALGKYNTLFANTVCILEEREPTPDHSQTEDTKDVQEKIQEESDHLVLQKDLLKKRLMDMLVGDWDRHADQWRWGVVDSANKNYYYAIPRDRDNALYYSNGLLPALAKLTFMQHITGFKRRPSGLRKLNFKSVDFDKTFLNELDAKTWRQVIRAFQQQVSDSVILQTVKVLPPPVYALDGATIAQKLKSRRDGLMEQAMKYYAFISARTTITGTDDPELFVVSGNGGKVAITVYQLKGGKPQQKVYERTFDPSETKIILLDGINGDDHFTITEPVHSPMRLKITGSDGNDIYNLKGKIKAQITNNKLEGNGVVNNLSAQPPSR